MVIHRVMSNGAKDVPLYSLPTVAAGGRGDARLPYCNSSWINSGLCDFVQLIYGIGTWKAAKSLEITLIVCIEV